MSLIATVDVQRITNNYQLITVHFTFAFFFTSTYVFILKTKPEIQEIVARELGKRSDIVFAYLFGSFVENERFRDIDVALYFDGWENGRQDEGRLGVTLEQALGCSVDLVVLNNAPDHIIHAVTKGVLLLDRRPAQREDFVSAAWIRYLDIATKRREYTADLATA